MSAEASAVLVFLGVILAGSVVRQYRATSFRGYRIHRVFGLSPIGWKLLSTDLGGMSSGRIVKHGLIGKPDAIFKYTLGSTRYVVGEYKNREHRGHVRKREKYQVILYVGLLRAVTGSPVSGVLAYRDAAVAVKFSPPTFEWLLSLRNELAELKRTGKLPRNAKATNRGFA